MQNSLSERAFVHMQTVSNAFSQPPPHQPIQLKSPNVGRPGAATGTPPVAIPPIVKC